MIFGVIVKLLLLGYGESASMCPYIARQEEGAPVPRRGDGTGVANINKIKTVSKTH